MIFNNILRNNPNKYSNYISVDDIPKGAPIEILDTVCYGDGMTGNEDSEECIAKGGQLVKIKNKTTKIKLELTPENDVDIDAVNQKDLYYKKIQDKIPFGTIPANINNYNNNVNNSIKNGTIQNTTPTNTGITYNIGQESTNVIDTTGDTKGFNPQPTKPSIQVNDSISNIMPEDPPPKKTNSSEHPPTFDDYDNELQKCKRDAIINSTKITLAAQNTTPQTTNGNITIISVFKTYKTQFIILLVIVILLIFGIIYNKFISE